MSGDDQVDGLLSELREMIAQPAENMTDQVQLQDTVSSKMVPSTSQSDFNSPFLPRRASYIDIDAVNFDIERIELNAEELII